MADQRKYHPDPKDPKKEPLLTSEKPSANAGGKIHKERNNNNNDNNNNNAWKRDIFSIHFI